MSASPGNYAAAIDAGDGGAEAGLEDEVNLQREALSSALKRIKQLEAMVQTLANTKEPPQTPSKMRRAAEQQAGETPAADGEAAAAAPVSVE